MTRQAQPVVTYNPGAKTVEVVVPRRGGAVVREALTAAGFRQRGKAGPWYKKTKQGADAISQVEALIARAQAPGVDSGGEAATRGADPGVGEPGVPGRVRPSRGRARAAEPAEPEPRTRETAFAGILERAKAVDPLVQAADLKAEYDTRLDILHDLAAATATDDGRGINLLKAIAGYGGLSSDTDLKGEIAWLKESLDSSSKWRRRSYGGQNRSVR